MDLLRSARHSLGEESLNNAEQRVRKLFGSSVLHLLIPCKVPVSVEPSRAETVQGVSYLFRSVAELPVGIRDKAVNKGVKLFSGWEPFVLDIAIDLVNDALQVLRKWLW